MDNKIWRKKPLEAYEADIKKNELKRVLGKWSLTAIGIGAIIGGGIFVLTGTGAHNHAGPALALSFVVAGVACIFAALCYAEFSSMLPVEGSAYAYAYGTVGEIFAWLIGWGLVLEYAMGAMTVAVSWSRYFTKFIHLIFKIDIPFWLINDPISAANYALEHKIAAPNFALNLPAFLIVWIVTAVLVKGIKEAASANNIIVLMKVCAVIFVIIAGAFFINVNNWHPFIPDVTTILVEGKEREAYGWGGIMSGASAIFFAYIGFDAVSTQAGEAINPRKDMPFAIIVSLLVCTVLYILVSLVLTGMINYKDIVGDGLDAPVAYAFEKVNQPWAVFIVTAAATVGLLSVMLVMMLGQSRIFLGMAKDGLLPSFFRSVHPKFRTPWKSNILIGIVVSLVASVTPINILGNMTSFGTLFAFAMVCLAVWLLRIKSPELERTFKVPALPIIAILGILTNIYLIIQLDILAKIGAISWLALGVVVYFVYSKRHSNLEQKNN